MHRSKKQARKARGVRVASKVLEEIGGKALDGVRHEGVGGDMLDYVVFPSVWGRRHNG